MGYYRKNVSRLGAAHAATVQPMTIPASVGGVNSLDPFTGMAPDQAIYLWNLVPSEYGLRLRKGYREWATGVDGDVRTLIQFDSQEGTPGESKLFAVSENGIYDVTDFNTTVPTKVVTFTDQSDGAGYGSWTNFTSDASDNLLLFADERNGLHYYNGDTGLWERPDITFPVGDTTTIDDIAVVKVHKQRVWLVKRGSADAYYLPIDAKQGAALKFNFGSKFEHGGTLRNLWSWTIDGGDGVDDFMVALSGGGDLLVYYGPDPSLPQWSLRGSYFIGQPPQSRRISTEYGGDLYILSSYGVVSIRDLLNGVDYSAIKVGPSGMISRFLREDVAADPDSWQWGLEINPAEGFLQIITPLKTAVNDTSHRQYVMNLLTSGWGWWRGVPMICAANQEGEYFLGGADGVVYIYDGSLDGTLLDGTIGEPIAFGGLTSFQPYGNHAQYMNPGYIRTVGVTEGVVAFNIKAVFDYQFETIIQQPSPATRDPGSEWDADAWDEGVWDFGGNGVSVPIGTFGWGRVMGIGYRGSSERRITLNAFDVMYMAGGLL